MPEIEVTATTTLYPKHALAAALADDRISSQALWLLLSLDQYGWRVEYDAIRVVLDAAAPTADGHWDEHAPLIALGQLFALIDKLWRLVYAMRAHRAGNDFLNKTDGYLTSSFKFHKKLEALEQITPDEWEALLGIPSRDAIRIRLVTTHATDDDIAIRIAFASDLPGLVAKNMQEIGLYVAGVPAIAGPNETTTSLRGLDGTHRHGAPVVYHATSPTDTGWVAIDERTAADDRSGTVGVIMGPPDEDRQALISLFKHDEEMRDGLKRSSGTLAALVLRLTRAHLIHLAPDLVEDPLAAVADYDV